MFASESLQVFASESLQRCTPFTISHTAAFELVEILLLLLLLISLYFSATSIKTHMHAPTLHPQESTLTAPTEPQHQISGVVYTTAWAGTTLSWAQAGALTFAMWTRPESEVLSSSLQMHICLLNPQTTTVCSRQHMTYNGM